MNASRCFLLGLLLVACGGNSSSPGSDAGTSTGPVALDETRSTLSVTSDATTVADGASQALITVKLIGADGRPLAATSVDLTVSGSSNQLQTPPRTDAHGVLSATLTSTTAELKTVSAIVHLATGLTPLYQEGSVRFVAGPPDHLAFVAIPASVVAGAPIGAEVAIEDAHDNVVDSAVAPITLSVNSPSAGLVGETSADTSAGAARFDTAAITQTGSFSLTASSVGLPDVTSATFSVTAASPSAALSSVQLNGYWSVPVSNDPSSGLPVTVTVKDGYGNACVGCTVALAADGSSNFIEPASGTTDAAGIFVARFASTRAETKQLRVTSGGVVLTNAQVTFVPGAPAEDHSTFEVSPSTVVADGVSVASLSVNLRDAFGNSIPNLSVSLSADVPVLFGNSSSYQRFTFAWTDTNGRVLFSTRSARAQTVTFHLDRLIASQAVAFVGGPASQVQVTAPAHVYANEPFTAQVMVTDAQGNPASASGPVTLALTNDASGAVLSGTLNASLTDGGASFTDLAVDRSDPSFQLAATAGSVTGTSAPIRSDAFRVVGPYGGDILAIGAQPDGTAYVGTAGGGLYRSTDNGASWSYAGDGLPAKTITRVVTTAAASPHSVLLGTSSGVYWSTDEGSTWQLGANTAGVDVRDIAFDQFLNPGLLLATPNGVMVSRFGTNTWTQAADGGTDVLSVVNALNTPMLAGTRGGRVLKNLDSTANYWVDVGFDFGAPVIGVSAAGYTPAIEIAATDGAGVFRSTNLGQNWTQVSLPSQSFSGLIFIEPTFWAMSRADGLFRSDDKGVTWSSASTGLPPAQLNAITNINRSGVTTLLLATAAGVYSSTDSAAHWGPRSQGISNLAVTRLVPVPGSTSSWLASTGAGGVFESDDSGLTWAERNVGLTAHDVDAIAFAPGDASVIYAATTGGVFKSVDGASSWSTASNGLSVVDLVDLAVAADGTVFAASATGGVFASADQAVNWTAANNGLGSFSVRALAVDGTFVYAATDAGVFVSSDDGANWAAANNGLTSTDSTALVVDAVHRVWVGSSDGTLFHSAAGAASWTAATSPGGAVQAISFDPFLTGTLYVGSANGLKSSSDDGATWTDLSSALRDGDVLAIGADASSAGRLLIGTRHASVIRTSSRGR